MNPSCFLEIERMKRNLFTVLLTLAGSMLVGCAGPSAIKAQAPGGSPLTGSVSSAGSYTLYHVSKFDEWGQPAHTDKLATVQLNADEHIGFKYVLPKEQQYNPDAQSSLVAYAGSFTQEIGAIPSINDHYYWCSPSDWDNYWAGHPARWAFKTAVQY